MGGSRGRVDAATVDANAERSGPNFFTASTTRLMDKAIDEAVPLERVFHDC